MKPWGISYKRIQTASRADDSVRLAVLGKSLHLVNDTPGGVLLVEGRVKGVEVFAVQPVGEDAEALSEISNLSKNP